MSGIALVWAANVKGLKPHTKIVLIQLADFHNKETGRCFPSAQRLADECEMDRTTVFRHLAILENAGLISRHSRGSGDGGRASNEYQLHLDIVLGESARHKETSQKTTRGVVAESDGGSGRRATGVVAESDSNLNTEPGTEPEIDARAPVFSEFWAEWPNKVSKSDAERAWKKLKPEDRRRATERIREWFPAWRSRHPEASPIYPATYLNRRRWEDEFASIMPGKPDPDVERWNRMGRQP